MRQQQSAGHLPPLTLVRRYPEGRGYEREAEQLAQQGYRVAAQIEQRHRFPRWRVWLTLGGVNVIGGRRRRDLVVTYQRG